jgi:hypothetical protein
MYQMYYDFYSVLDMAARAARRSDLVAVWKEGEVYRLVVHAKVTPEAIAQVKTSDAILILVQAKPTRIKMNPGELQTWHQVVRDANAWFN